MKRFFTALLLFCCLSSTTLATDFTRTATYQNQFQDVSPQAWYATNVQTLYEYGLSNGKTATTFAPDAPVLLSETATFAARIRSQYASDTIATEPTASWYQPYVTYLQEQGVIAQEFEGRWAQVATRAEVAHLLANLLPTDYLPMLYTDMVAQGYGTGRYVYDVSDNTPYQSDILQLYRLGLVNGVGDTALYQPDRPITRAELAAILTRIVEPSLRIQLDWTVAPSADGVTYASLVPFSPYIAAPQTLEEIDSDVRWMLSQGMEKISLQYESNVLTAEMAQSIIDKFTHCVKLYCEQMYNQTSCYYFPYSGKMELTFSSTVASGEALQQYREAALQEAIAVHDALWASGFLTENMTQTEKAKVYYQWLCENCSYNHSSSLDSSLSHTSYAALCLHQAVCDGYVGAYNLFLKMEGIDCSGEFNNTHIWTVAELDGTLCYIDPTWGDGNNLYVNWDFFGMTAEESAKVHG